jgi:hypothetical protein
METEEKLRLADVFVSITDPRQANKVEHDLVELLVVAVKDNQPILAAPYARVAMSL